MTYTEAIESLRGHPDWWRFDIEGSDRNLDEVVRERTRGEAIALAQVWVRPIAAEAAPLEGLPDSSGPCCGGAPLPP
jgi:hypothetical protein